MAVFKCKICGGNLELVNGSNIVECPYCSTMQTVPTLDDKLIRLYNRANQYRLNGEFDKAYSAYEAIVSEKNDEAEAFWGMVLSEFGVEYVEDPETGKRIPTCNRTLIKPISANENYKAVLSLADVESKALYEDEAEMIDSLQKKILNASAKEEPCDVFICYKETDSEGNRTEDSVLAQQIYDELTGKGYRVFFSRISLEDKLGRDYEPCIYAALTSAKVMLVVTTDTEHCNSVWVKNEWKRYIGFMKTDREKTLIPVYKDMSPYALPDEFSKLQAQDMSKIGALQDLVRGVEKLVGKRASTESALSDDEKKLLSAFEKSQNLKKSLVKILISGAIGVVLVAVLGLTAAIATDGISELILFRGVYNRNIRNFDFILIIGAMASWYVATFVSFAFFRQKTIRYIQYSLSILFALFSVWLVSAGLWSYTPTAVIWLGYAAVGISALVSSIVYALKEKKIPFVIAFLAAVLILLMTFEGSVPKRSNERDRDAQQIIIVNEYINIRREPSISSQKIGVVNEGEIYTVLSSESRNGSKWIKIRTGLGTEGYIVSAVDGVKYCKELS